MVNSNFSEFLDPLVGTPQAADQFAAQLAQTVQTPLGYGPYSRLEAGLIHTIDSFTMQQAYAATSLAEFRYWTQIGNNAKIGGARLAVNAAVAIGQQYRQNATVPQERSRVLRSARTGMGYVLGLAMMDSTSATMNVQAAQRGWNPRNWALWPLYFGLAAAKGSAGDLYKVFTAKPDEDGQLTIKLRHRPMGAIKGGRCPATFARTELDNGRSEGSLWRYLRIIGDVAVDHIYPYEVDIIPDQDAS